MNDQKKDSIPVFLRSPMQRDEDLLDECRLQLEYLNGKFGETGTTNNLLARLNYRLEAKEPSPGWGPIGTVRITTFNYQEGVDFVNSNLIVGKAYKPFGIFAGLFDDVCLFAAGSKDDEERPVNRVSIYNRSALESILNTSES